MNRNLNINKVCNYILDSELDDFAENPSENHVYYIALAVLESEEVAAKYLEEAIKDKELTYENIES